MAILDALTGGAANTAAKNNMATINTGLTQGTTTLGDNYTSANNYVLGSGLPALQGGYHLGLGNLGTGYADQRQDLSNGYGAGQGNLTSGYGTAIGNINSGYNSALGVIGQGYGTARDDLNSGFGQARTDLGNQYGETQGYLGRATANYQPIIDQTAGSVGQYENAIGANGAAGSAAAHAAFTAAPGYQYALDQSLGSVQRSAAARGGLAGGNATSDILNTANGLANQGYQQYVNNLNSSVGFNLQGIQGQNTALTNQANASQAYGTQLGNLDTTRGTALAGNDIGYGNAAAGLYVGQGAALAGLNTGLGTGLNASNIGLGTNLGSADANLGTGSSALNVGSGTGTYGAYNQVGSNLMNLGNQVNADINHATDAYVKNNDQLAAAKTASSGNLLGTIAGIANSPLAGSVFNSLGSLFK